MRREHFLRLVEDTALEPAPTTVSNVLKSVLEAATVKDNVVENVHILGYESANGYRYKEDGVKLATSIYENASIYLNHGDGPRRVEDKFACIKNVRFEQKTGLWGDVVANAKHPYFETFKWWAAHEPSQIGLSHDAFCVFDPDEAEIIEITQVNSVDLVSRPATVKGLFESVQEGIIDDSIKAEEQENRFNKVVSTAINLMERTVWSWGNEDLGNKVETVKEVATDLTNILSDFESEAPVSENLQQEEQDMKWEDIDFKALEENRPDLVTKIRDDHDTVIKQRQKKLEEALKDVPEQLRSDLFVEQVESAIKGGNDDLVAKLVEDRKSLVTPTSTGVVNSQESNKNTDTAPEQDSVKSVLEEFEK